MRFHTSLTRADIESVELPPGVYWHHLREYGSRSRARAFEIVFEGNSCFGGQWGDRDYKAATWDEWGVILGRLFALDPNARVSGIYEGAEHYHWATGERFYPDELPERLCPRHNWRGWDRNRPGESWCTKCEALRRWSNNRPVPEPRDDTASQRARESARVWVGTSRDFLEGRTTPARRRDVAEVDTYGERYETYDGPYKGRNYAAEFSAEELLLAKIDELIKEG